MMLTLFQPQRFLAEKRTETTRRVVAVVGDSLLMDGLEAGLRTLPGLEVIHIPPELPDTLQYLNTLAPNIILFDWDSPHHHHILSHLRQNPATIILGFDLFFQKVTHLSGRLYTISSINGLLQLLEQKSDEYSDVPLPTDRHIPLDHLLKELLQVYIPPN